MSHTSPQSPWWSYGHVWLVLSGPLLAVVASIISAVLAFQGNDTVLQDKASRHLVPAVQARNHAATPEGTALKK